MYAVIETGGKQYRVEVGTVLEVELLDVEPGQSITLDRVLLVADGDESAVGQPIVDGAAVEAEVVGATRGDKVIAFKYQPKARRRVKKGHRQNLTVLRISDIRLGGKSAAKDEAKAAPSKADEKKRLEEAATRQAAEDAALAAKLKVVAPAEAEAAPEVEAEAAPAPKKSRAKAAAAAADAPAVEPEAVEPEAVEPAEPGPAEAKNTKAFEIHEDKAGKWRWRLRARNAELVAMSDQGFASKAGVIKALDVVRRNVAEAEGHEEAPTGDDAADARNIKGFEIYEDKSGHWRWRLRASNGELLAIPEQGFASKAGVVKALDVVRRNVADAEGHEEAPTGDDAAEAKTIKGFEIYEDKSGHWRWRLRAGNGELLAIPEQGFSSKSGVVRGLEAVRRNVADAEGHVEPEAEEDSTPEAAPKRSRTKKDD
jgi:large subunit ribosomal protein L21